MVCKKPGKNEVLKQTLTLKTVGVKNGDTLVAEVRLQGRGGGGGRPGLKAAQHKARIASEMMNITVMHEGAVLNRYKLHP